MAAIRSLKVRFIRGFSNITTGADVGSLMSATHDVPDSVSNENGPDFSYLNGSWTGLEIAHLLFLATVFLLYNKPIQIAMKARTTADALDRPTTRGFLLVVLDLGFLVLACSFMGWYCFRRGL